MANGQPSTRLIMTWGWGRSENDQSSPKLFLLLFRKQGDKYQSLNSIYARELGGTSVEEEIPEPDTNIQE